MASLISENSESSSKKCSQYDLDVLVLELRKKIEGKPITTFNLSQKIVKFNSKFVLFYLVTEFPGFIVPRTDYDFLARFLRVKDYKLDRAYSTITKFYYCIHKQMEYHKDIRPSQFAYCYESKAVLIFKERLNGAVAGVARIRYWEPKVLPLLDAQKAAILGAEQYLKQVEVQENGIICICDMQGLRFEHLWHATIKEIRRCAQVIVIIQILQIFLMQFDHENIINSMGCFYRMGFQFES